MADAYAAMQPPPDAVTTTVAAREEWPGTLSAIGTVQAVQGVTVAADLPGLVERIAFESGRAVREGQVLVELDTRQEQAQLAGAEAQLQLTKLNFERMKGLVAEDAVSRAEFDAAAAAHQQAEARLREIQATIARKTIRAPFSGVLGLRQVNLGQYLTGGDPIVSLQSLNPIYVTFTVPQHEAARVRPGRDVRVSIDALGGATFTGRVSAAEATVDPSTRNVQIQATFANPKGQLRPGMFVQTEIAIGTSQSVVALPASSINYAPYGDSVFVVADMTDDNGRTYKGVRQQVVTLGPSRGDLVAVLSGIEPGQEVVTSGVFKLRNGAPVQINNSVQPASSPAPTPEDR
jgi:membrane fusion protein (multidrug efflux system)